MVADIQEAPKIGKFHETEPQSPTVEVVNRDGGEAIFVETDVADERAVEHLVERASAGSIPSSIMPGSLSLVTLRN